MFPPSTATARTGCTAACLTHPIDVVKTRMMTQAASSAVPYTSALDCLRSIVATEGLGAFCAGLQPRVAYIAPLWAVQFMLNERICRAFGERNARVNARREAAAAGGM